MSLTATEHLQLLQDGARRWSLPSDRIDLPQITYARLNGLRFRLVDWASSPAPGKKTVLLLHGGGLTAHAWDLVCLGLRTDWRCVAIDARGHGDSDWAPHTDYLISSQRTDVLALLEHLGLEQVAVIAHSMGGFTSMSLAAHSPQRIAALTLVDISPEPREAGTRDIRGLVSGPRDYASLDEAVQKVLEFRSSRNAESVRRSLKIAMREGADGRWRWKYDPGRYVQMRTEPFLAERRALWEALANIQCPTQIIRGEKSGVLWQEDAERVASLVPQGRWRVAAGAGHNVHSENPVAIIDAVRDQLNGIGFR